MRRIYICAPFRGPSEEAILRNVALAVSYGQRARETSPEVNPIIPHLESIRMFGLYGSDTDVVPLDDMLLRSCEEIWVFGAPSAGMRHEMEVAQEHNIKIVSKFRTYAGPISVREPAQQKG